MDSAHAHTLVVFLLILTQISGGFFFQDHELIEMFWEVLKSLSSDNQKKFLKLVSLLLA